MKAAVLHAVNAPLEIEDVALDAPGPQEVRVRVAASGLCHSDLHFMKGDLPSVLPVVLGHEAAGLVEAVGSEVRGLQIGDHVVSCVSMFCGHCRECVTGHTHICEDRPVRAPNQPPRLTQHGRAVSQGMQLGAFAEEMLIHQTGLVKVPRELPLDRAALLGCCVLTGVGAVLNGAKVRGGSQVAVIGCGGVGLNVVQGARIAGAGRIIAVDLSPEKLELARKMGATDTVLGGPEAVEAVREISKGGVDYAFEVIGLPQTINQAVRMLRRAGTALLIGIPGRQEITLPGTDMLRYEWRVQGTVMGSSPFMLAIPEYAALYLDGRLDLDSLIAERIALADINRGYEAMEGGAQARSVIVFDDVLHHAAAAA